MLTSVLVPFLDWKFCKLYEVSIEQVYWYRTLYIRTKKIHFHIMRQFSCSVLTDSMTPQTVACQASCPSPTPRVCSDLCPSSWCCHPSIWSSVALSCPALNLSQHQGLFQWVNSSHQVPKYQSFSLSISLSNKYSKLISLKIDSLDLLAVQGTLKSLLQHHSSKHQFFGTQLSLCFNSNIRT